MASLSPRSSKRSSVRILPRSFYERDTLVVSRALLGKVLEVGTHRARIVETEAYRGDDPASHSSRGETPRTKIMFGPPGVAYVYFIYGMYEMLNFVTEKEGQAGAVLIRAVEPLTLMKPTNGPGKLCKALGIRLADNGQPLDGTRFRVVDDGFRVKPDDILESPRVGITKATDRYWRFFVDGSRWVSKAPQNALARPRRKAG